MTKQARLQGDRGTGNLSPLVGVTQRITDFLRDNPGERFQPKTIAKFIRAKHETVKRICQRLSRRGTIIKETGGWYKYGVTLARLRETEDPPVEMHGWKIELTIPNCPPVSGGLLSGTPCKETSHKPPRIEYFLLFNEKAITIIHHACGLVEIWTGRQTKMDLDEFFYWIYWLEGVFEGAGYPFWRHKPIMKQYGIHKDYTYLRMGKVKDIRFQYAKDLMIEMYEKKKTSQTRIGVHGWGEMGLREAMRILDELKPKKEKDPEPYDGVAYI